MVPTPSPSPRPSVPPPAPSALPSIRPSFPPGPLAPLVFEGSRARPIIALTIDDGGSVSVVLAELAILRAQHVNATFFPIGTNVEENPAAWRTLAAAGFPIGNHTYDHADLTCRDFASVVADIEKDTEVVGRIVGHALVPFLRPPGGAWDQAVLRAAEVGGEHSVIMWDTTVGDSGRGPVSQLVANGERARAGSIVLMHANDSRSAQALPELIAHYRALGYGFATLGQLLGVPGPAPYPVFPASARPWPTPAATSTRLPTSPPASPSPSATEPRAAAASRFREAGLHRQRRFE